jgi:transposase
VDDDGSSDADARLGLDGFVVLAAAEVSGELHQLVETTASPVGCPACGVVAVGHGRRRAWVRDLPAGGRPVALLWAKRVWRCADGDCPQGTWTEHTAVIGPRASLTERARRDACWRVGRDGHSVAQVARDLGVGWATVMTAVRDHGAPLVDDPARTAGVAALGMDETAFLAANQDHHTLYVTGFVDVAARRLLDVVPGRSAASVAGWLDARPTAWLRAVGSVALDPHRGYANGLLAHLGHATVVVDHFHAVQLANAAIDDVRRRVQQQLFGHRGRKGDPLYRIRRVLLRGADTLGERAWDRLHAGLAGDRYDEVGAAWLAKELLRDVYAAVDQAHARRRLTVFYQWCADAEVAEVTRLAKTIAAWQNEVLAYHHERLSNGPTEAMNLLVKKIKRVGHGFRNFANYRLRLLLHCGVTWQDQPTARLRPTTLNRVEPVIRPPVAPSVDDVFERRVAWLEAAVSRPCHET